MSSFYELNAPTGGKNRPTRCILGLVDGDGGAGQGHAAGVLQRDVDAVGARLREAPPQAHFTRWRRRDVVARYGVHLGAAGVRHDGAGRDGGAGGERKGEWLKVCSQRGGGGGNKASLLSLSQTLHQETDVRFGDAGSRHVHDATFWPALQRERRFCGSHTWSGGEKKKKRTHGFWCLHPPIMVMLPAKVP